MKNLVKYFKSVNGQSLAEFAVTTAMMATLATTAAPKFSGVGEGAKEKKTLADIDKILKSANNFYNEQVTKSGRGRFPGQWKYNEPVPSSNGYTYTNDQADAEYLVKLAVQGIIGDDGSVTTPPTFTSFDNTTDAPKWASCFGTNNPDALIPEVSAGSPAAISTEEDPTSNYYSNGDLTTGKGAEEFLDGFGGEAIKSPFQDGHYIYTVVAGGGSGESSYSPILYIADLESPKNFNKKLQP